MHRVSTLVLAAAFALEDQAAAAATFDRLPTRTAGWRRGSPVDWLKDHGGERCARRSPTCWMATQVVRGRIAGISPDHDMGWTAAVTTLRGRCGA